MSEVLVEEWSFAAYFSNDAIALDLQNSIILQKFKI